VTDFKLFYTLSSWINLIEIVAPETPVIILGTHASLRKDLNLLESIKSKEQYIMRYMDCVELSKRFNVSSYFEMDSAYYMEDQEKSNVKVLPIDFSTEKLSSQVRNVLVGASKAKQIMSERYKKSIFYTECFPSNKCSIQ